MTATLEAAFRDAEGAERRFRHKRVLFVGSQSYDAPTVTVLQGLHRLGFRIFTPRQSNINSWFCNHVLKEPRRQAYDFALSNLHWGTRWSDHDRFAPGGTVRVLIDGTDHRRQDAWRDKAAYFAAAYGNHPPPPEPEDRPTARWAEPPGEYEPDVVFTSQKVPGDARTHYLPFGIQDEGLVLGDPARPAAERDVDVAYVPGPGRLRRRCERWVRLGRRLRLLPGRVHVGPVFGDPVAAPELEARIAADRVIQGWSRWRQSRDYFGLLSQSKLLVYPAVNPGHWWDSKRPWEALAAGCVVVMQRPTVDVAEYPVTELAPTAVYDSPWGMIRACRRLLADPAALEATRRASAAGARRYFAPVALARYFLRRVAQVTEA